MSPSDKPVDVSLALDPDGVLRDDPAAVAVELEPPLEPEPPLPQQARESLADLLLQIARRQLHPPEPPTRRPLPPDLLPR